MKFGPIAEACIVQFFANLDCSESVLDGDTEGIVDASADRLVTELPDSLTVLLEQIRLRTPNARIALVGYPELFETETSCVLIDNVNQDWLNDITNNMDETIAAAALNANEDGDPAIFFVDLRSQFSGHNLCTGAGVSAINGLEFAITPGESGAVIVGDWGFLVDGTYASRTSIHPNTIGTQLYADALEAALAANP